MARQFARIGRLMGDTSRPSEPVGTGWPTTPTLAERILALHPEVRDRGFHYCGCCAANDEQNGGELLHLDWPCPTVQAVQESITPITYEQQES